MSTIHQPEAAGSMYRSRQATAGAMRDALGSVAQQQRSLQEQLQAVIASAADKWSAAERIAQIAQTLVNASFLSFVRCRSLPSSENAISRATAAGGLKSAAESPNSSERCEPTLEAMATVGSIAGAPSLDYTRLQALCLQAIERDTPVTHQLGPADLRSVVVLPIRVERNVTGAVVALLELDDTPLSKRMLIMDLVSYALRQWESRETIEQLDWQARTAAAITELVGQIESSSSLEHACLFAANSLNEFFAARFSSLGFTHSRSGITLKSISSEAGFDRQSERAQRITAAMEESLVRDDLTAWPPLSDDQRHAVFAHRQLAQLEQDEAVLSVPLKTLDGEVVGVWLSCGQRSAMHDQRQVDALRAIAPYLATSLRAVQTASPGPFRLLWQKLKSSRRSSRLAIAATMLLVGLMPLAPVRHRIAADVVVEPVQRRFVTVPFDGVLRETLVRPGDRVMQGQCLAVMDDQELGWQLDRLIAESERIAKKGDEALAMHDPHAHQLAELERQSLEQQIQLLRHRKDNLKILSALDGVVLTGDLSEVEGAPVTTGQTLFEIAPLSPLRLEVAVADDEIAYVERGMTVTARLRGHPQDQLEGTLESFRPRAEVRENRNVFVAEATLENRDEHLRPGMQGRARINGPRRALGWVWFHKSVDRLRDLLGV